MTESNGSGKPNVLWICTDQQRYDTIGVLGNETIRTPNIDGLVNGGVAFTRAYCQNPICQPSRASFMTGLYPSTLRVNGNGVNTFPENVPLISKLFADGGYICGLVGKLHLNAAYDGVEKRVDDGYSYWHYSHTPHWQTANDPSKGHDYVQWVASQGEELEAVLADPEGVPDRLHHTTWCAEKTKEFMVQNRGTPWFVNLNIFYPHPPFNPPQEYLDLAGLEIPDHMQGCSLKSILCGKSASDTFREFVRSEYYDAQGGKNRDGKSGFGTMYRDDRYKLVVYHGYDLGELYDLEEDPGEFENRWDDPEFRDLKLDLKKSFDASMLITDWGGVPVVQRTPDSRF